MRTIALMNQKGGVGKTTTTVNLGAALAEMGQKVCLIDLDPQAHLTINYGVEPGPELVSLYNVLVEEKGFLDAVHRIDDHIAIVPSSIDLAAAEIELVSVLGREQILRKRLEGVEHDFDFILLDCPPSLGLLTINALSLADEVIIPMQAHFLALQGVGKLLETVALVGKRMNPRLRVSGIVLTMFDAQTKLSMEVVNDLNGFIESAKGKNLPWANARIFRSKIRRNIKLAESPSFGQTILKYEPTSNGAADYRALAREILGMSESEGKNMSMTPPVGTAAIPALSAIAAPVAAGESGIAPARVSPVMPAVPSSTAPPPRQPRPIRGAYAMPPGSAAEVAAGKAAQAPSRKSRAKTEAPAVVESKMENEPPAAEKKSEVAEPPSPSSPDPSPRPE